MLRPLVQDVPRHFEAPAVSREGQLRQLFHDYYRPVFYYFASQELAPEECRDLTQETFVNAHRGIDDYRQEASVKTWLFRIARNVLLNRRRELAAAKRQRPEVSLDDAEDQSGVDPPDSASLGPEGRLLQAEQVALVRDALARLPPQRRRCLILRLEDLKYREIGDLLGISLQAVRSHLFQAREQLRDLLGDYFNDRDLSGEDL
jgi:RNA polymerase sigma-70 factor (ECF subfamily)